LRFLTLVVVFPDCFWVGYLDGSRIFISEMRKRKIKSLQSHFMIDPLLMHERSCTKDRGNNGISESLAVWRRQ